MADNTETTDEETKRPDPLATSPRRPARYVTRRSERVAVVGSGLGKTAGQAAMKGQKARKPGNIKNARTSRVVRCPSSGASRSEASRTSHAKTVVSVNVSVTLAALRRREPPSTVEALKFRQRPASEAAFDLVKVLGDGEIDKAISRCTSHAVSAERARQKIRGGWGNSVRRWPDVQAPEVGF